MKDYPCQISYKCKMVTSNWLARNYLYKFQYIASMRLVDLKTHIGVIIT